MNCPYCREGFSAQGELSPWRCAACNTAVHAECAAAHAGCVTYGCNSVELHPDPGEPEPQQLRPRWPARVKARQTWTDVSAFAGAAASEWVLAVYALLGVAMLTALQFQP